MRPHHHLVAALVAAAADGKGLSAQSAFTVHVRTLPEAAFANPLVIETARHAQELARETQSVTEPQGIRQHNHARTEETVEDQLPGTGRADAPQRPYVAAIHRRAAGDFRHEAGPFVVADGMGGDAGGGGQLSNGHLLVHGRNLVLGVRSK